MHKQQPKGGSAKAVHGVRQVRRRTSRVMEIAALINACSNFVAQLDAHQVGAAIVLCIIALTAVSAALVALALTLRAALASREGVSTGNKRGRRVDNGRQIGASDTSRERQ